MDTYEIKLDPKTKKGKRVLGFLAKEGIHTMGMVDEVLSKEMEKRIKDAEEGKGGEGTIIRTEKDIENYCKKIWS